MTEATEQRLPLARRIAEAYAADANARVVMIAGSVGRGSADRYSDVEIDVYYDAAPTLADRAAAVERAGATLEQLAQDEDEWEEQMLVDGLHVHTSTFLVTTMERYLREVVDECATRLDAQSRLFSLQHGVTVKGEAQVEHWRTRADAYPEGLRHAMLAESLSFDRFRYAAEMLAARDDLLLLYDVFVDVGRRILGALLAVNRIYAPSPVYLKSMDETIALMPIAPGDLARRLKQAFRIDPPAAVADLDALVEETFELVEMHVPGLDRALYRGRPPTQRRPWPPA